MLCSTNGLDYYYYGRLSLLGDAESKINLFQKNASKKCFLMVCEYSTFPQYNTSVSPKVTRVTVVMGVHGP